MSPVLGYWKLRGLCEPIRYLLAYSGTDFEEKLYVPGDPPEWGRGEWEADRLSLGLDFPNIPYYIDGDLKLTQSIAIMRYLARKYDLNAKSEEERIRMDLVEQQLCDFRWGLLRVAYVPVAIYGKMRTNYLERLPEQLRWLSEFLGSGQWLVGDRVTYVDFIFYEALDHHRLFDPDCLKDFSNLQQFMTRFEELPAIKKYMESDMFRWYPLYAPFASFGGTFSPNKPEKALEMFPNSYVDMGYSSPWNAM